MPKVKRPRQGDEFLVEKGALLMQSLQDAGVPVASSCAGDGICCKCALRVTAGAENLSRITPKEEFLLLQNGKKDRGFRISCQARVLGDVSVDVGYW